jgi:hypothetical protein
MCYWKKVTAPNRLLYQSLSILPIKRLFLNIVKEHFEGQQEIIHFLNKNYYELPLNLHVVTQSLLKYLVHIKIFILNGILVDAMLVNSNNKLCSDAHVLLEKSHSTKQTTISEFESFAYKKVISQHRKKNILKLNRK